VNSPRNRARGIVASTEPPAPRQAIGSIRAIEAALTKPTIVVLGVLAIAAATLLPWFSAHALSGSAEMAGWGAWTTSGHVNAGLRIMPMAVTVYSTAGLMIYGAVRGAYGIAVVGAMTTVAAAILPHMLLAMVDRRETGSESVGIDVASAPGWVLVIALVATVACWIAYARCVLRARPRADA
jgi:Trk-type K+ transport system membrane component